MIRKHIAALCTAVALVAGLGHPALAGKDDDTLRVAWGTSGAMVNADNYYGNTTTGFHFSKLVFDMLVEYDAKSGEFQPGLAIKWSWIDDKTLEMELKPDVKFHNGASFGADDVAYTLNTIAADKSAAMQRFTSWIDTVEKTGDLTIRIHAKEPFPQALAYLAGPLPIYPHEYYKEVGPEGMNKMPIGTGPYKVVEMKPGEQYTLERNDDYIGGFKQKAHIKNLVIREIPDAQTQAAELMAGGIDFSGDMTPDLIARLQETPDITARMAETIRVFYMSLDAEGRTDVKPMTDRRVRQAINYAIDREAIVKNLTGGAARVLYTPCHPAQFGCDESRATKYPYDPDKAKALLAEAGLADGFSVDLYAEAPAYEAEAILGYLQAVGIKANLKRLPWEAAHEAQVANKVPVFLTNWGSFTIPDVAAIASVFFKGGDDDTAKNPDVIASLEAADKEPDPEKRKAAYGNALATISEEAYWVPLFSGVKSYAWSSAVEFEPNPDGALRFYEATWR